MWGWEPLSGLTELENCAYYIGMYEVTLHAFAFIGLIVFLQEVYKGILEKRHAKKTQREIDDIYLS